MDTTPATMKGRLALHLWLRARVEREKALTMAIFFRLAAKRSFAADV
jgi:hypothetical protein